MHTTTKTYTVHHTKWGLERVEHSRIHRPYHYLFEVERLFPQDPWLKQIKAVIKWEKNDGGEKHDK